MTLMHVLHVCPSSVGLQLLSPCIFQKMAETPYSKWQLQLHRIGEEGTISITDQVNYPSIMIFHPPTPSTCPTTKRQPGKWEVLSQTH